MQRTNSLICDAGWLQRLASAAAAAAAGWHMGRWCGQTPGKYTRCPTAQDFTANWKQTKKKATDKSQEDVDGGHRPTRGSCEVLAGCVLSQGLTVEADCPVHQTTPACLVQTRTPYVTGKRPVIWDGEVKLQTWCRLYITRMDRRRRSKPWESVVDVIVRHISFCYRSLFTRQITAHFHCYRAT